MRLDPERADVLPLIALGDDGHTHDVAGRQNRRIRIRRNADIARQVTLRRTPRNLARNLVRRTNQLPQPRHRNHHRLRCRLLHQRRKRPRNLQQIGSTILPGRRDVSAAA